MTIHCPGAHLLLLLGFCLTRKSGYRDLPPALQAEIGEERYDRLELYWGILSFPFVRVARAFNAHRAARVEATIRAGLAAID